MANTNGTWITAGKNTVTGSYAFRSKAAGTVEDSAYGQIPSYAVVNLSTGLRGDFKQGQWDVSFVVEERLRQDLLHHPLDRRQWRL